MVHKSITIHWQGPYPVDKDKLGKNDFGDIFLRRGGLYLFTGKTHNNEKKEGIKYIGIAEGSEKNCFWERFKRHHHLPKVKTLKIWLGTIYYPRSKAREYLEETESILIYFVQPKLNSAKKVTPPGPLTVINKWHKANNNSWSSKPRHKKPYVLSELDDVLIWDGEYWWTADKLRIYEDE